MQKDGDILIIGRGQCPHEAAVHLADAGARTLWAIPEGSRSSAGANPHQGVDLLHVKRFITCQGQCGNFHVALDSAQEGSVTCRVKSILVATDQVAHPNYGLYGLQPCSRVSSLFQIEKAVAEQGSRAACTQKDKVLFLNSWQPDSHPEIAASMLRLCLQLQQEVGAQTFFFTGNLKVSMAGMERIFQDAKAAGAVFVRSNNHFPALAPQLDGRIKVQYHDEVTREDFQLMADRTIVDERLAADPFLAEVADILRLERDADDFLQQDNVRRLGHLTNRKGVFVAGAARGFMSPSELTAEAKRAALCVWDYVSQFVPESPAVPISEINPVVSPVATIDQSACARCLTCYRLCPYAAIGISPRMEIFPPACQGCGLCRAGCPNRAIRLEGRQIDEMIAAAVESHGGTSAIPRIVAFCCKRSAAQSQRLSACAGHRLPEGMMIVEGLCGGTLSVHDLLRSFEEGADGVMVLTCHDGNCHSGKGSASARIKVLEASKSLALAGISSERIHFSTLASNMMYDFARRTENFARKINEMGPLKIVCDS